MRLLGSPACRSRGPRSRTGCRTRSLNRSHELQFACATPAYIISEKDFAIWTEPADSIPKTWLLINQQVADVARVDRSWVCVQAELLRRYAAILRGQTQGTRYDDLLTDSGVQRIVASDLTAIARDLESWIEHDWIAVINISAERQHLAGPLPPFPGIAPSGTQTSPPEEDSG